MKLKSLNPADNWQERILVGNWIIPGLFNGDTEVFGELRFDGHSSNELKLTYNPKEISLKSNPIDVVRINKVYGECNYHDGASTQSTGDLLFDCFVTKATSPLDLIFNKRPVAEVTIVAQSLWLGTGLKNIESKENLRFREFEFGISGLESWCDEFKFISQVATKPSGIRLEYLLPKTIDLYDDEKVDIKLRYSCNGPECAIGQTELKLAHHARLCIKVKDEERGMPYYGEFDSLEFYSKMVVAFFSFLIGDGEFAYDFHGVFSGTNDAYFYMQRIEQKKCQPRHKKAPYTAYKLLIGHFPERLREFILSFKCKYGQLWTLNKYINAFSSIDDKSLSELLFAFEGLFDVVFKAESETFLKTDPDMAQKERFRNEILDACAGEAASSFAAQRIQISLSYAQKLRIAFDVAINELTCLRHTTSVFRDWIVALLKNERVSAAHSLENEQFNAELFFAKFGLLKSLLLWMIMRKSGFSMQEIYHVLCSDYNCESDFKVLRTHFLANARSPLVSLIIPVYNVAPYLKECLGTVLSQTYKRWEAICVDDGSTDESGSILDEYAGQDSRIKVIHQKNAGVSSARNIALAQASGDWLFFFDADDLLHPKVLEQIVACADDDVDIVFAKHQAIKTIADFEYDIECRMIDESDTKHIGWDAYFHPIFATAFRSTKFKRLRFNKAYSIGEDRLWFVEALDSADKIVTIDFTGYGYRIRENSATQSAMTEKKFTDEIRHFIPLLSIIEKSSKNYDRRVLRRIGQSLTEYASASFLKLPKTDRPHCLAVWQQAMKTASNSKMVPLAQRLVMKASIAGKYTFLALLFCYLPYWLKSHGLHR